ncbi:hypothetical protein Ciccas_010545, partial [Cichlidogyrus casuarinus]
FQYSEKHSPIVYQQGGTETRHDCNHCQHHWVPSFSSQQRSANTSSAQSGGPGNTMVVQPFAPKEVMDIARPVPINKVSFDTIVLFIVAHSKPLSESRVSAECQGIQQTVYQNPTMGGCYTMENGSGMSPCGGGHGTFQRSRSYEVLDGINGMVNGFNQMNLNHTHSIKKKASLPPASHHSPEQRTSYRDNRL